MKRIAILLCAIVFAIPLHAQNKTTPSPIIFIYDASGSMWGQLQGKTKMEIATEVLSTSISSFPKDQNIGLVAYGHRKKGDCRDVEFLVDISSGAQAKVNSELKKIKPLGMTPLAYSASLVIDKLKTAKTKATIILVTDGIESCDGNICNVVKSAKKDGIDFKLHIIGFGLKAGETEQLKCAAKAGEGQYYDAADASDLGAVLNEATAQTVDKKRGNFGVFTIKNNKAVDGLVKAFKAGTKAEVDAVRTYGDTSYLRLAAGRYDLEARALENSRVKPVTLSNIEVTELNTKTQIISFDGGKVSIYTSNNGEGWDSTSKIIDKNGKIVGGSRTYGRQQIVEVNPGVYDIEVAVLRINGLETKHTFENVKIVANKTVEVSHDFKTGIAMIGVMSGTNLLDATVTIKEVSTGTNVAGSRTYTSSSSNPREFILNPGKYAITTMVVSGDLKGKKEAFEIVVKQGETTTKIITY